MDADRTRDDAPALDVVAREPAQEADAAPVEEAGDAAPEPDAPTTGDPAVDEAAAEVAATAGEPLETRLAAYERAHRTLQDRLADVEG